MFAISGVTIDEFIDGQSSITTRPRKSSNSHSHSVSSSIAAIHGQSLSLSAPPLRDPQASTPRLRTEGTDFPNKRRVRASSVEKTLSPRSVQARDSFAGLSSAPIPTEREFSFSSQSQNTASPKKRPRVVRAKSSQISHLKSGGMAFLSLGSSRGVGQTHNDIPTISEEGASLSPSPSPSPRSRRGRRGGDDLGEFAVPTSRAGAARSSLKFAPRPPTSPPPDSPPSLAATNRVRQSVTLQRPMSANSPASSPRGSAPVSYSANLAKSRSLSSSEGRALAISVKQLRASTTMPRPPTRSPPPPVYSGRRSPSPRTNTSPRPPSHPPERSFRSSHSSTSSKKMVRAATLSRETGFRYLPSDDSRVPAHKKSVSHAHTLIHNSLTLSPSRSTSSSSHTRSQSHAHSSGRGRGRVSSPSSVTRSTSPVLSGSIGTTLSRSPSRDGILRYFWNFHALVSNFVTLRSNTICIVLLTTPLRTVVPQDLHASNMRIRNLSCVFMPWFLPFCGTVCSKTVGCVRNSSHTLMQKGIRTFEFAQLSVLVSQTYVPH